MAALRYVLKIFILKKGKEQEGKYKKMVFLGILEGKERVGEGERKG